MTMTRSVLRGRFAACLAFAGVVTAIDQLTKQLAWATLPGQPPVEILPFLQFTLVLNKGAAFGLLADAGRWPYYFLTGLSIAVSIALVIWLWRAHPRNALLSWGLALVLGGALGNLIDRVSQAYVIDFILLHYKGWYFPTFNIADSAITLGAVAIILDSLRHHPDPPAVD